MPVESMNAWFEKSFKTFGPKKAITFFRDGVIETEVTYFSLLNDVNRFVNFLSAYDLEKGDRVILLLEKSVIGVVAHIALLKAGLIAVPLNPGFKRNELEYLISDANAGMIMVDPDKGETIKGLFPGINILEIPTHLAYERLDFFENPAVSNRLTQVSQKDPGLIIYTSGTTGNPKGAVLTHGNLVSDAKNIISIWEISQQDVLCHALPLFHIHGLCFALHTALLSGCHVLMLDRFSPDTVLQMIVSTHPFDACTIFMGVPAMYTKLMDTIGDEPFDFSHMRLWTSGSAPLLEKGFDRITRILGKEPVEREGMSETGMNFSNPIHRKKKPGSIGLPLPGVKVRIVLPETGRDVSPGMVGEIWLKSPSITKGYWQKPVETAAAFKDGWFKTGDLAKIDKEGYYYLTDRIKHLIISGGENISAKEVETVINGMEGIREASVVGILDETWGEKVVALVEKYPGVKLSESRIKSMCKEKLHDWKCPKKILFTEKIPKNTMGKVLKEKVKFYFQQEEKKMTNPIRLNSINGLKPGDTFIYKRTFTQQETVAFGDLTKDYNPVHYDERWTDEKNFKGLICHGLLVGSMICEFGGQVGWLASGMKFKFILPVYFDDTIQCAVSITKIDENGRAEAEAVFTNQKKNQVGFAQLKGRLPVKKEREILRVMTLEGDPTNQLRDAHYPLS